MRRVLLVDSNRVDCGRLARILQGLGYGLDVTFSAHEARMMNERQSYSWSVIGMPLEGVDGVELFTELRERQARIRGLLVANNPNRRIRTAAQEAGLDIVSRPVDINVLVPWLSGANGQVMQPARLETNTLIPDRVDEGFVARLSETGIREEMSDAELIQIIRGVDYPFAGKDRLEMFDRDTLVRVVLLIKRWCLSRR
jgi:CheY-like chemotaxis protein